jgi:hypothetical protein
MGEYADSLKKKKVVPPQAARAQASETKQQAAVEKKYTAPAKNKGEGSKAASDKAKADALKEAQKKPVKDAHDKPSVVKTPVITPPPPIKTPLSSSAGPSGSGSSSGSSSSDFNDDVNTTPPMNETPAPTTPPTPKAAEPKTPTRDVTNISSLVPQFNAEHITKILFENLSAVELSIVERHDTIEGINQRYSIISNLSDIRKKYDIAKQLTVMDKFKPLTRIFTINIEDKIPQEDYIVLEDLTATYQYLDENNQIVTREKGYYYIDTNGDLVIELINMERNQQVEVEIDTNGTIYKVES